MCLRSNGSRSPIPSFSYACTIYNNADAKKDSPCFQFFLNCMLPNHWQADPEKVLLLGLSMSWLSDWLSVGSVKAISLIRTCLLLHLPLLETALNRGEDHGCLQTWRAVAEVYGLVGTADAFGRRHKHTRTLMHRVLLVSKSFCQPQHEETNFQKTLKINRKSTHRCASLKSEKYQSLTHLPTYNLESRDASASKNL